MTDQLNEFTNENGCPKCGSKILTKVRYTWWGGILGPRLMHHTKCETCGYRFNGKTGKSNTTPIIIYTVATFVIILVVFYFIRTM